MQPQLDQGESGGRDIVVVTDWMAKKMYDLGYLQKLDKEAIPNGEGEPRPEPRRARRSIPSASTRCRGRAA